MTKTKSRTKPMTKTDSTDTLYNEALDSLKKLNEEILLNKMNEDFKELLRSLQDEMENFKVSLKEDLALLNGQVHQSTTSNDNNTNDVMQKLEENSTFFLEKLKEFSEFFKKGLKTTLSAMNQANGQLTEQMQENIQTYSVKFKEINEEHTVLTAASKEINKELDKLIQNYLASFKENEETLKHINENWLVSIESLNKQFKSDIETISGQVSDSNTFYVSVKSDLLEEIGRLSAINDVLKQAFETTIKTNKQQEVQAEQNKELLLTKIAGLKIDVKELKGKNEGLALQLKEQEVANNKAQKVSLVMQCITIVGVIAAIIVGVI